MNKFFRILDDMRDHLLKIEYAAKVDSFGTKEFDNIRDELHIHSDLLADLRNELAAAEDKIRYNQSNLSDTGHLYR